MPPSEYPRVLVFGASGFLGSHVADAFDAAGWRTYRGMRGGSDTVVAPPSSVHADVIDSASCVKAVEEIQSGLVVNCAAYGVRREQHNPSLFHAVNVRGPENVVRAAAGVGAQVLQIGTAYEYGPSRHPLAETSPLAPIDPYGVTKAEGSMSAMAAAEQHGVPFTIARLFGMYGPRESPNKLVPAVMAAANDGVPIEIAGGDLVRDYAYVQDVADGLVMLAEHGVGDRLPVVNLGSGRPVRIADVAVAASQAVGGPMPTFPPSNHSMTNTRVVADPALAQEVLRWQATTTLEEGMKKTARSMGFAHE